RYVSKDGAYSFELNTGDYELTATYSLDETHKYSSIDKVSIKNQGEYVYDLFLLPDFEADEEGLANEPDIVDIDSVVEEKSGTNSSMIIMIVVIAVVILIVVYFIFGKRKKKQQKEEIEEAEKAEEEAEELVEKTKAPPKKHKAAKEHIKTEENDLDRLVDIIKKEGGRTTQKEIRKQIPLSEAKISLMITELEHKGVVEKIKKGRGNVIMLKR
ncbi:hypothetical protein HZB90_01185, partial [archaeon]|nr:hypothetical protein [archaeon]